MINMALTLDVFLIGISLMTSIEGEVSPTGGDSCTKTTCHPPFPYCDEDTRRCEALGRIISGGMSHWSRSDLSASNDRFVKVVCSADGDYPSADCRSFYRCHNGTATLQTCSSPGYPFFDPALERCTNLQKCPSFDCFNRPDDKIGFTNELSPFFSYCVSFSIIYGSQYDSIPRNKNAVLPLVISRCFGKDTFNPNSRRCEPMCLQEGLIPDTIDCHKYYLCSLSDPINGQFTKYSLSCPQGEAFQDHLFRCVPEHLVSQCKSPYPWPT